VDWTLLWFKELKVFGTNTSAEEKFNGEKKRCYQIALELMEKRSYLLTHTFPLKDYKKAIEMNFKRSKYEMVKSAFKFEESQI
jgi:threonine dehydrogenase-like Zn-dependent dehydrogenase